MNERKQTAPSVWAQRLGYGGLVPFVALALALWLVPPAHHAVLASALAAYGATILSFVGALHWGLAMRSPSTQSANTLVWGVVPSLMAWVALLLPTAAGLLLIAAMLWVCCVAGSVQLMG